LQDFEVAAFETPEHIAFVVSKLEKRANLAIASNLAPAVRDLLGKLEG
jgi:hypothetical protein